MILKDVMQCSEILNFEPLRPWPEALPAVAHRGLLVAGFGRIDGLALQIDESRFEEVVGACYSQLSFAELSRLWSLLNKLPEGDFDTDHLMRSVAAQYQMRWNDRSQHVAQALLLMSKDFVQMAAEKSLSEGELSPLLALRTQETSLLVVSELTTAMLGLSLSRSEWAQTLELVVECSLMGHESHELKPRADERSNSYIIRLRGLRHPITTKNDLSREQTLQELKWPKFSQARWARAGDRAFIEIKLQGANSEDLIEKLARLKVFTENELARAERPGHE